MLWERARAHEYARCACSRDASRAKSHGIVECTLVLTINLDGIGVAVPGTCLESDSVLAKPRERIVGSQVLISAGPFANGCPQWTPAAATILDPLGVGTLTLPPITPTLIQDDGRFCFWAELFIVFRSALLPASRNSDLVISRRCLALIGLKCCSRSSEPTTTRRRASPARRRIDRFV
jgi:hypothetical protein